MVSDWVSVPLKDILKKIDDFLRKFRREFADCPALPPPPSKLERLWRAQRRRADRERWHVRLKHLELLYTIKRCKPYQKARSSMKRKAQLPTYYGKNIAQHAQKRFFQRKKLEAEQQEEQRQAKNTPSKKAPR